MFAQVELKSLKFTTENQCNGATVIKLKPSEGPFDITLSGPVNSQQTTSLELLSFPHLCEGIYEVSVKDNHGCVSILEFEIEVCEFLGTDVFFTLQPGCEVGIDGTVIGLNIFPDGEYYYKWSTGAETDYIFASSYDTYYVTVTDVNGCNHVTSQDFEVLQTDYEVYSSESSSLFQCSGKIAANAEGIGSPFLLKLFDSDQELLYETTIEEFAEGIFEFPIDVCIGDYTVEITNAVDCIKELDVSVLGGACDFSVRIDNVIHPEGNNEGSMEVKIMGEITNPSNYLFELFAYSNISPWDSSYCDAGDNSTWLFNGANASSNFSADNESKWEFVQSQVGDPILSNPLPSVPCMKAYRLEVSSIYDPTCKRVMYLYPHECDELNAQCEYINLEATINSQISYPELGSVTVSYEVTGSHFVWYHNGLTLDAKMVGPNGEIFDEYDYRFDYQYLGGYDKIGDKAYVTFNNVTEPGEYCIILSNTCEKESEICVTFNDCPSIMSFYTIDEFNYQGPSIYWLEYSSVFPENRPKPANFVEYDDAYTGNGRCIDIENCYSEEDTYTSDCNDPNDEKTIFYYEPFDHGSPCSGGTVSVYQYDFTSAPLRTVLLIEQFEFNAEATHSFEWENNENEYQPGSTEKSIKYAYSGFNKEMDETGFDAQSYMQNGLWRSKYICESGAYCLFESGDLFEEVFTDEYILLTSCMNWTTICDIWPDSKDCNDIICNNIKCPEFEFFCEGTCPSCEDGIQNQGEEDIDCGGLNCEPCSDCFNGVRDGNETWPDCGPTCQCSDSCDNGISDGCETGIDCGGPCCTPCNNSNGDPGSDDECASDWDCPAIGFECVNGECVPIECDPDAFFSDCNLGETCVDGVCVVECDEDFDCPIGYICGPDGICIEEDDVPPTDDCDPECEAPDYECFNGNCIYVGEQINDCSSSNPCPTGQYCKNGNCKNCPIITFKETYGNNNDCKFEMFLYSDHNIVANIKVYLDITELIAEHNLGFSSWNPANLQYQVPSDCELHYYTFEFTFEDCQINSIEVGPYGCDIEDCIVNDDPNDNSIVNKEVDVNNSVSSSEKLNKNTVARSTAQGLIKNEIKCYPNPTGGSVNLFSTDLLLDRVEVYNVIGQKQIEFNFEKQDHLQELDIHQFNSGIYFLKVFDSNHKFQLIKIVKN